MLTRDFEYDYHLLSNQIMTRRDPLMGEVIIVMAREVHQLIIAPTTINVSGCKMDKINAKSRM